MPDQIPPPHKTILEQGEQHVKDMLVPLGENDRAAVAGTHGSEGTKIGGAIDIGKGVAVGAEAEKNTLTGWRWFVGGMWRWKRKP